MVAPTTIEPFHQRQQRGGFAGLPRGVQHEVVLALDQPQHFLKVKPFQGRNVVVVFRNDGASGVEIAHHCACNSTMAYIWGPTRG